MIAITGGGTGGHLAIAKAFKEEFCASGERPLYVGSLAGQDRTWFCEDTDFSATYFLNSTGVVNKRGFAVFSTLFGLFRNIYTCIKLIRTHHIDTVVSVGGYSAAPLVLAALLLRKKLFIHEQNAVRGALNKISAPFACALFSSFDHNSPVSDYPVRTDCFTRARTRVEIRYIIFLGGSQGAKKINELALELAPQLQKRGIHIIHQCGDKHIETTQEAYQKLGITDVELFGFTTALQEKIEQADFAVARSGASTLFELAAQRIPAFFIPYPFAAANHQEANAAFLTNKGGALYKTQASVTADDILAVIDDKNLYTKIAHTLSGIIAPGGAHKIVSYILSHRS